MTFLANNDVVKQVKQDEQFSLHGQGGEWLGSVRHWIQWNCRNGSNVDWGSDTPLQLNRTLTVLDLEVLAADIARATLKQFKANLATDDETRALRAYKNRDNWRIVRDTDNDGNLKVFDPDKDKLHFAQREVKHGWECAEFQADNWKSQYETPE